MEPKFQTSFIPKKPLVVSAGARQSSSTDVVHNNNILSIIATVLFVVAFFVSGALFGYKYLLTNQIAEADQNVNAARDTFELDKIQELIDANSRIVASNDLLEAHIVASEMLYLLEDLMVKRIQLKKLEYKKLGRTPTINFEGTSLSYNAIADQNRIFNNNDYIVDGRFYNMVPKENGNIDLTYSGSIDAHLVSYRRAIEERGLTNIEPTQIQNTATEELDNANQTPTSGS